ncbi:oligosaccharide flippase family protein [Methylobacillus arboreus]|uniref:lipopolysaccharide biosynthesis protein n=1 Tax=Methylobacillus arboreus TaxID=755170 RepID=UPI001E3EDF2E|nr:oligosaccharide flippase family protein [Methylobacillus arboreus]MCB5189217.1 oligosaccharide flippase family protein [Methylobacillus arboreus]
MQKTVFRIIAVWSASIVAAFIALLLQVILARNLHASTYGILASNLSLFAVLGALGHFGMGNFLIRNYVEKSSKLEDLLKSTLTVSLVSLGISLVFTIVFASHGDALHSYTMLLMFPVALSYAYTELAIARMQIQESFYRLAISQVTPNLLRLLIVLVLISFTNSPLVLAAGIGLGSLIATLVSLYNFGAWTLVRTPEPSSSIPIQELLIKTWPYGLSMSIYLAYTQGGVVVANYLDGPIAAANYSIAISLLMACYLLPIAIFQRVQGKKINDLVANNPSRLKPYFVKAMSVALASGLIIALLFALLSYYLILYIFGEKYINASSILTIVAFSIPFRFAATASGTALNSYVQTRFRVIVQFIVLVLFLSTTFYFAPVVDLSTFMAKLLVAGEILIALAYTSYLLIFIKKINVKVN